MKAQVEAAAKRAAEEARLESAEEAQALKAELLAKEERLRTHRETELALRKEKSALEEKQKELALEIQRQVDVERKRIEQASVESYRLREAEWRKKIDDAQKANADLKRKLEQGSQQLQGEVLELEIEDLGTLRSPVMLIALTGLFDISGAATTALDRFAPADARVIRLRNTREPVAQCPPVVAAPVPPC